MTFRDLIDFLDRHTLSRDPWWVLSADAGTVRLHFLGIITAAHALDVHLKVADILPAYLRLEVTSQACFEHEDCRYVPELGAACWVRSRQGAG